MSLSQLCSGVSHVFASLPLGSLQLRLLSLCSCTITPARRIQPVLSSIRPACSYLLCKCHFCHSQKFSSVFWDRTAHADQKEMHKQLSFGGIKLQWPMLCFAGSGEWLSLPLPPWLLRNSL